MRKSAGNGKIIIGSERVKPAVGAHTVGTRCSVPVPKAARSFTGIPLPLPYCCMYVHTSRMSLVIGKCNVNPLTPELNPSAQRCLTRFFTGDFVSSTVHFVNVSVKNQQIHKLFIHFINYVW
jgi:hypothetical protein